MKTKALLNFSAAILLALGVNQVSAQSRAPVATPDQIRNQAANIRQYKELLASPDASIRYAAVSEMLKSNDNGMRVLAFDMAFQSPDSSIRALALKERVLTMGSFVMEPANDNVASQLVDKRLNRIAIPIGRIDLARGVAAIDITVTNSLTGTVTVAGEEVIIDVGTTAYNIFYAGRFRLSEGGKLIGGIQWTLPTNNGPLARGVFPAVISVN